MRILISNDDGVLAQGLECLVHEASHYNWSRHRRLNDLAANVLAAIPVFSTVGRYRVGHFIHHRMKGAEDDPKFVWVSHMVRMAMQTHIHRGPQMGAVMAQLARQNRSVSNDDGDEAAEG